MIRQKATKGSAFNFWNRLEFNEYNTKNQECAQVGADMEETEFGKLYASLSEEEKQNKLILLVLEELRAENEKDEEKDKGE
ncbi:MAG: hypothetical protein J6B85_04965 [Lachnospiraceae bacterium]|nr:hypothetical protein [Lachnospiraceae bacterium]